MTSWDVSPDGVRTVLGRTETVAGEFETQMADLNAALSGAASQSSSEIVAEAIAGYAESATASLQFVFERTGACMTAAANATNAYVEGDLEMAATAQESATAAPDPRTIMPGQENIPL